MGANIAGIYGAQIFRSDDKPLYRRGFAGNIAILATAFLLALVRFIDDRIRKRRKGQAEIEPSADSVSEENGDEKKVISEKQ